MKVLITTEFYLPFICGITTAVLNQRHVLEEAGHDVRILTASANDTSYYESGVYYIRQNIPQFYKDSYATLAFSDALLEDVYAWCPDIVHAQNEFFTFVFAKKIARKCKTPLILTCHTDYPAYGIHFMKNQKTWQTLVRTFVPRIIRGANVVLCSSTKIQDLLLSYQIKPPILSIKLGVNLSAFHKKLPTTEKTRLMQKYGISSDNVVFISVCRLSQEKSVDICLSIFSKVHKKFPNAFLLLVGEGTEKENLCRYAEKLGISKSVCFTGLVPSEEIWKYYSLADIFLNASESETQGLTFLESIASGIPVVCKDNPVNKNFLIPGVNGFAYSTEAECEKICCQLIENPEKLYAMRSLAPNTIATFSLECFKMNLELLYSIALGEKWVVGKAIPTNSKVFDEFGLST